MYHGNDLIATTVDFAIGLVISLVVAASYAPQHVQCLKLRSADGLSLWTVLISTISGVALTLASVLGEWHDVQVAATARDDLATVERVLQTMNLAMPIFQSVLMVCVGTPSYVVYYFCFSPLPSATQSDHLTLNDRTIDYAESTIEAVRRENDGSRRRFEIMATASTWLLVAFSTAGSILAYQCFGHLSSVVRDLIMIWGATATFTNAVQWIPQIRTTWTAQHEGVLSVASFAFSVFGDFLLAVYWIRSSEVSVWVYMTLAADASMQLILIAMILHFRRKRGRAAALSQHQLVHVPSTPLLYIRYKRHTHHEVMQLAQDENQTTDLVLELS